MYDSPARATQKNSRGSRATFQITNGNPDHFTYNSAVCSADIYIFSAA